MNVHASPQHMHLPHVSRGLWNALWYRMHSIPLNQCFFPFGWPVPLNLPCNAVWKTLTHAPQTLSITLVTNVPIVKVLVFPVSHVWMWELDHKENWALKNWCLQTVVLGKTRESPLDSKETKSVNPIGNQPWIFIGRTNAEAETPIFWSPDAKSWLIRKDYDAGKDWRQKVKRVAEDEMVR